MKVRYFPLQAHCFAFGGFEIQMLAAYDAIKNLSDSSEVKVSLIDCWSRESDFDIAHFWGLDIANYNNIYWAKKSGKVIVLTALLSYFDSYSLIAKHKLSKYIGLGKVKHNILQMLDALVVVNEVQKENAVKYYSIPENKVFVVPNIVNKRYFEYQDTTNLKPAFENYVLSTGNICERKNQLNLVKACVIADINLILVGKVLTGEDNYGKAIKELIHGKENIVWIQGLKENSDELINLIKNCSAFALISDVETQPISLLEAAVCQRPLIISDKNFARQEYYKNAYLVDEHSPEAIAKAIKAVMNEPAKYVAPLNVLQSCKEEVVGEGYIEIYKKISSTI